MKISRDEEIRSDIRLIKEKLLGTDKEPGICKIVQDDHEFIIGLKANNSLLKYAVGSGWGITIIVLIISFLR